ncbi:MAG: ATP-binding protein, partial [Leptolyngbyaceae bacterium]|nr:ATP-binding protein [Leptolyngbyaceae bacterium]
MLPPLARLPNLERLVAQRGYFVIHAPRQTGKTTAMLALAQQLTASGQYTAIMVSVEVAAAFPQDLAGAERVIRQSWRNMAMNRLPDNLQPPPWPEAAPGQGIQSALQQWARSSPQPLVVLIDEIDVLQDFNLSQGQPWLVNALAKAVVETVVPDPLQPITASHMEAAKEMLIQQRDTHVDSLMSILQEPRVRAVIEPMLAGQELNGVPNDDRQFLVDLGLVARSEAGGLVPANPIYREVLPRVLADGAQDSLPQIAPSWLTADGTLDGVKLLEAFLVFWRQHGQPLLKS